MRGKIHGVLVGVTAVVLAKKNLARSSLVISVGDATNASSVVIKDNDMATASNGFPLNNGSQFVFEGEIATHEFSAIRLAAVDCLVGVVEGFKETGPQSHPTITIQNGSNGGKGDQ